MIVGIIPARFASTRFPGKPLADIAGRSMIERVYNQALSASRLDAVAVATDDERIFDHVKNFGGQVFMTSEAHPTGTDRCAEAAKQFPQADFVINIQGDEPFIRPEQIDLLAQTLEGAESKFGIATLVKRIEDPELLWSTNTAKVVFSEAAGAIFFSRQAIPFCRGVAQDNWHLNHTFYKHIGMYGYRADVLQQLAELRPTPLEQAESLEQLRWLEHGFAIKIAECPWETIGIDSPEDLERVKKFL